MLPENSAVPETKGAVVWEVVVKAAEELRLAHEKLEQETSAAVKKLPEQVISEQLKFAFTVKAEVPVVCKESFVSEKTVSTVKAPVQAIVPSDVVSMFERV